LRFLFFSGTDFWSSTADFNVGICLDTLQNSEEIKNLWVVVVVKVGLEDCMEGFRSVGSVQ
jgi:hypothetical protein